MTGPNEIRPFCEGEVFEDERDGVMVSTELALEEGEEEEEESREFEEEEEVIEGSEMVDIKWEEIVMPVFAERVGFISPRRICPLEVAMQMIPELGCRIEASTISQPDSTNVDITRYSVCADEGLLERRLMSEEEFIIPVSFEIEDADADADAVRLLFNREWSPSITGSVDDATEFSKETTQPPSTMTQKPRIVGTILRGIAPPSILPHIPLTSLDSTNSRIPSSLPTIRREADTQAIDV